jgi:hemolysin III
LAQALEAVPLALLIVGGILYTVGGLIYALKKPNPWPELFGYLEVFHLLVIAGSVLHYWLVLIYVL